MKKLYTYIWLVAVFLTFSSVNSYTKAQASTYTFTTSTGATLTTMTGSTQIVASGQDLTSSSVTNIGFTFNFAGTAYTQFSASSNGAMGLGGTAVTTADGNTTTSSGTYPLIMPMWDDMHTCTTGKVHYLLSGSAPNRTLTVEWLFGVYADRSGAYNKRVQVKLTETTDVIDITYGASSGTAISSASVGIASSTTSFHSVTTSANTSSTVTANDGNTTFPASGRRYTFTPPVTCTSPTTQATSFTSSSLATTSMTIGWTRGNGNNVMVIAGTSAPTDPTSGTSYTANATYGSGAACGGGFCVYNGTGTSVNLTGLSSNTVYYFAIYEYNTTGTCYNLTQLTGNATTCPAPVSLPQTCDFTGFTGSNLTTVFPNFSEASGASTPVGTTSSWVNTTLSGTTTAKINLYSTGKVEWIIGPTFTVNNTTIYWKAAITDFASTSADASGMQGTDDQVMLKIKTCGGSWTTLYTHQAANTTTLSNTLTQFSYDLSAYNGQDVTIAFFATEGSVSDAPDYDFHLEDINILGPCSGTPTGGTATAGTSSFSCSGSTTITLTGYTNDAGISLQWQSSAAGAGSWSNISGATSYTYSTPTIASSMDYRCVVTCTNGGASANSTTATVTINVNVPGTAAASPASLCVGATSALSVTGATVSGSTYQWQSSPNNSTWTNISGATSSTYTASPTANTYYRLAVTCTAGASTLYSASVQVTVTGTGTYATLPFTESFETWQNRCSTRDVPGTGGTYYWTSSPSTGSNSWRRDDDGVAGAGWGSLGGAYSPLFTVGSHSARFHAYGTGSVGYMDLYVNCSAAGTKVLSFDFILDDWSSASMDVLLSTDGGATFSTTLVSIPYTSDAVWNTYSANITSTSSTCIIRFYADGDLGSYDIGLDNIKVLPPCSGTPTAGTANASPASVCVGNSSALSLTGVSSAAGLTYQWQSSTDNATWSNISNATSSIYTAYPFVNTYYRCVVTCSNSALSANSTSALVSVTGTPTYAAIPFTEGFETWQNRCGTTDAPGSGGTYYWTTSPVTTDSSWRRDDQGASASWTSAASGVYSPLFSVGAHSARLHCYNTDYTGYMYLYLNMSTASGSKTLMYDYINTSGSDVLVVSYSTDGGNSWTQIDSRTTSSAWTTYTTAVPTNSATCIVRFAADGNYSLTDIGLDNVRVLPPCTGAPTGGTASTTSSSPYCGTIYPVLTVSGYTLGVDITIQWQSSPDNSVWTNISGATSSTYTVSGGITTTTYYRALITCTSSGSSTTSSVVTLTSTNPTVTVTSPVNTCSNTPTLNASTTSGTINWYNVATGGSSLATGTSYTPTITSSTTYYVSASTGGSTAHVGKASWTSGDGYFGTSSGWGLRFTANNAFTLVSVNVYVQTAGSTVSVKLQDGSTGANIGSAITYVAATSGLHTITLNLNITPGTYRLVSGNSTYLGRGSTGVAFPYSDAGSNCTITSSEWGGTTTGTYYFFYDWVISTGCESGRTPLVVNYTAPVITVTPDGSTSFCSSGSVSLSASSSASPSYTYAWSPSTGLNTTTGATVVATPTVTTTYTVTGNNGSCIKTQTQTISVSPACTSMLGTGVVSVASLPYSAGAGTTAGAADDLTSSNSVSCGSSSYTTGEDKVWVFTPSVSGSVTITLTSAGTYTSLKLYDGCPTNATACEGNGGCVAYTESSTGNKTLTACLTAGVTYYLVLDSYDAPLNNPFTDLTISAPVGSGPPSNDLPCNATTLALGVNLGGTNVCAGSSQDPSVPSCWTTGVANTVWYEVVPTSSSLKIRTTLGTLTNTQIAVFSGSCSGLTYISGACNDDAPGCGSTYPLNSELTLTGLTAGNTYYIVVDGEDDLVGTFNIMAVDGASSFPGSTGQECSTPNPVCASVITVGDPGYQGVGSSCDESGTNNCTGGERGSAWYTLNILAAGSLSFTIYPNDYTGSVGDETDYDFVLWKTTGTGATSCALISSSGGNNTSACNFSYLGVTGLSPSGNAPAPYSSSYDEAFEPSVTVAAGDVFVLEVENYSNSTSGFTLDFTSTAGGTINYVSPTSVTWTGGNSTTLWNNASNWGSCTPPTCSINAVVSPASIYQPTITSAMGTVTVQNLTIDPGATLTLAAGATLKVCGNLTNNGTITADPTSTILFNDDVTTHTLDGNLVGTSKLGNLTITDVAGSANCTVVTNQNLDIGGTFTTSSATSIFNSNGKYIKVAGNFSNNSNSTTFTNIGTTGTLEFNGTSAQSYSPGGSLTLNDVVMNHSGTGVTITGANDMTIGTSGTLTLTSGVIITGTRKVDVTNDAPTSVTSGNTTSYVQGNLSRNIQSLGSYDFPVGLSTASKGYQLENINFTSATSITNLTAFFNTYTSISTSWSDCGTTFSSPSLDNGYWDITATPSAQKNTGVYTATLYNRNYTNASSVSAITVMADHGSGWGLLNGDGSSGTCVSSSSVTQTVRSGMVGFSKHASKPSTTPLPVNYLSFTGKANKNYNSLKWITASEKSNDHFDLEKSSDGREFAYYQSIKGNGTSSIAHNYSLNDDEPFSPVTYYRLKQVDADGGFNYSEIISLESPDFNNHIKVVEVYPNPAKNAIHVKFKMIENAGLTYKVLDVSGRIVLSNSFNALEGENNMEISIDDIAPGAYFIELSDDNNKVKENLRFVKQ